ncbi:MAG: long-chain-fatty-acid--CoA ligase [Hyphomicrobiaceae bacterium]|nr:long-chain-fatty-acid--CoA ligase [Hyphomicrobiaceae bacterium]
MLKGLMMDRPLLVSSIIDYAAEVHATTPIVTAAVEGGIHRQSYSQTRQRVARLANVLLKLGVKPGDRVATLAWNTYRHFELYFAIAGIGAVCHTINPRLFPEQMTYIVNHAQDTMLFLDTTFVPLVAKLKPSFTPIQTYVALTDRAHMPAGDPIPGMLCYEELLALGEPEIAWRELDENSACALCYTSGTTGDPKGALYSHRSTLLHSFYVIAAAQGSFLPTRPILPVVPLFHANAWGLPFIVALTGAPFVMPGARLDGSSLFDLMDETAVWGGWGVPTVWLGLLEEMKKRGRKPGNLSRILTGGSAIARATMEQYERDYAVDIIHGWGMTEMSPVGTVTQMTPEERALPFDEQMDIKSRQGRRMFGVEMKIVDENGNRLPHDGKASGELFVRGAAVVSGYYENPKATAAAIDKEGWFGTGDVATITPDGWLVLVDRTKDLVKSGGEWISSIDVENVAIGCPGVANAAVIAVPHPKWYERPLLVVVKAPGAEPTKEQVLAHVGTKLAKWQVPDEVVFVDALPLTATGKVSKKDLRARFADFKLDG